MEEQLEGSSPSSPSLEHPLQVSPKTSPKTDGFGDFSKITRSKTRLTSESVPQTINGLKELAKNGAWHAVLKLSETFLQQARYPHDVLQIRLCRVVAQLKMRLFKVASDELEKIGDFDDKVNRFEHYPELYPNLKGSMVPFTLRIIRAELAYYLKTSETLDPLFELLALCKQELSFLKKEEKKLKTLKIEAPEMMDSLAPLPLAPTPILSPFSTLSIDDTFLGSFDDTFTMWAQRETRLIFIIATRLVQQKEFSLAIQLLEELIPKYGEDPTLLSGIGRIYLHGGNIRAASSAFKRVEAQFSDPEKKLLVHMNRGIISLALNQHIAAIEHFQAALDIDPKNVAAANNKAICFLYTCDLTRAIETLESCIRQDPEHNLQSTLVFNLCTLYELKSHQNSQEKKKNLMNLATKFVNDSFDYSVLKLN